MNDAEAVLHRVIGELETSQREAVWAYRALPRWRIFARRRALAVAEGLQRVANYAVRRSMEYWNNKAART